MSSKNGVAEGTRTSAEEVGQGGKGQQGAQEGAVCADSGPGAGAGGYKASDVASRLSHLQIGGEGGGGGGAGRRAQSLELRYAVQRLRFILEGNATCMPKWVEGVAASEEDRDEWMMQDTPNTGTYELPPPSPGCSRGAGGDADHCLSRDRIGRLLNELVGAVLERRGDDVKLLKVICKAVDTLLNGVDIVQKHSTRLQLRYSVMKSTSKEYNSSGAKQLPRYLAVIKLLHHHTTLVQQRHRKLPSSPLVLSIVSHVTSLATYHYQSVRIKSQPALLSSCRRYAGTVEAALPRLVMTLEQPPVGGVMTNVHEQRVTGAAVLLQTRYFQWQMMRDWPMFRRFVVALCASDHNDKPSVHSVLVDLFNTFQANLYKIPLDMPPSKTWVTPQGLTIEGFTSIQLLPSPTSSPPPSPLLPLGARARAHTHTHHTHHPLPTARRVKLRRICLLP